MNIKFRLVGRGLAFRPALIFILMVVSTNSLWAAQAVKDECPLVWAKYINVAKDVIADRDSGNRHWVLFADETGTIYNCLGEGVSDHDIEVVQIFEKDLARVKAIIDAEEREKGDDRGRASACGFGTYQFTRDPVFIVSLTRTEEALSAGFCGQRFMQDFADALSGL